MREEDGGCRWEGCRSESDSEKIGAGAGGGSVPPRLRLILLQKSVVPS